MLHTVGPVNSPLSIEEVGALETIATHSSSRIGMLRAMSATEFQAATDPLTGLLNRRALENKIRHMMAQGIPFSLAIGNLDHFKALNDAHGHFEAKDAGRNRIVVTTESAVIDTTDLEASEQARSYPPAT